MATTDFRKVYTDKVSRVRDLNDIRTRASKRLKDKRKCNREDTLNLHRQVEYIPEVQKSKKRTEQEETLLRLKIYKQEKVKRMEEEKKVKKAPFYNLVLTRHTGGTPFRTKREVKMPVMSLPRATRARTALQNQFVFKAKPNEPKEQKVVNQRIAALTNNKNKQPSKITVNIKPSSSKLPQGNVDLKQKSINAPSKAVVNKEHKIGNTKNVNIKPSSSKMLPQGNIDLKQKFINTSSKAVVNKEQKIGNTKNVTSSSKRVPPRNITTRKNSPLNEENLEKLNSLENTIEDFNDLLAERLAEQVVIMSPIKNSKSRRRRLTQRHPNLNAGNDLVNDFNSPNKENEVKTNNQEEYKNKKSEIESGSVGPEELRNKLNEETARLISISDLWSQINTDESIPEDAKDEILAVVGQTRLLLSDKFQQFKSLIDNAQCKQDESSTIIKSDDLLGFWEMMYIGVEQLNQKYKNLEDMKNNHWHSCEKVAVVSKSKKKKKANKKKKNSKPTSSKFRDFLKNKQEGSECNKEITEHSLVEGEDRYIVPDIYIS